MASAIKLPDLGTNVVFSLRAGPLVGLTADHFGLRVAMMLLVLNLVDMFAVSIAGKATYE
jgi:hypothetical protein